ncbi:membrane insertase COX18 SCDLUD_005255 [Saccharomycodes ludwigii]|uniref:membrane insertase COX18 n=1 Tax=Saccharomycodes ludwigii TaxID=36035 RepID=UPI001E8457F7|nr:hypothetical protein SCDLUD_005255 [Saccharomycodes ludwigii]KAH3898911.1 hypothetical protein SCDLUD_005255 [Saccharomycodes ludwigii]
MTDDINSNNSNNDSENKSNPVTITFPKTLSKLISKIEEKSGLSWPLFVPASTIVLRTIFTLPLMIWQRKRLVRQQQLSTIIKATRPVLKLRLAAQSQTAGNASSLTADQITLLSIKETRKRQKKLFKENGVEMWKNTILPLVQVPLWISYSLGLRSLDDKILQQTASTSIFDNDLVINFADYPFLLPGILGTLALWNIEYNAKIYGLRQNSNAVNASNMVRAMGSIVTCLRFGAISMMCFSVQQPPLLVLYWITSQGYSAFMNWVLNKFWPYEKSI